MDTYSLYYSEWHKNFKNDVSRQKKILEKLFLKYKIDKNKIKNAVDIGCGNGATVKALIELLPKKSKIMGIDSDKSVIDNSKINGLKETKHIKETVNWCNQYKNNFDLIILFDVLEHIHPKELNKYMKAFYSILKEDGIIIIQTPNAYSPMGSYIRYNDLTHHTSFTFYSIKYLLEKNYFQIIDIGNAIELYEGISGFLTKSLQIIFRSVWFLYTISEIGIKDTLKMPKNWNLLVIANKKNGL